jgi:hypothetical protein
LLQERELRNVWLLVPISSSLPTIILEIYTSFAWFNVFLHLLLPAQLAPPPCDLIENGALTVFLCDFSSIVTPLFAPLHKVFPLLGL